MSNQHLPPASVKTASSSASKFAAVVESDGIALIPSQSSSTQASTEPTSTMSATSKAPIPPTNPLRRSPRKQSATAQVVPLAESSSTSKRPRKAAEPLASAVAAEAPHVQRDDNDDNEEEEPASKISTSSRGRGQTRGNSRGQKSRRGSGSRGGLSSSRGRGRGRVAAKTLPPLSIQTLGSNASSSYGTRQPLSSPYIDTPTTIESDDISPTTAQHPTHALPVPTTASQEPPHLLKQDSQSLKQVQQDDDDDDSITFSSVESQSSEPDIDSAPASPTEVVSVSSGDDDDDESVVWESGDEEIVKLYLDGDEDEHESEDDESGSSRSLSPMMESSTANNSPTSKPSTTTSFATQYDDQTYNGPVFSEPNLSTITTSPPPSTLGGVPLESIYPIPDLDIYPTANFGTSYVPPPTNPVSSQPEEYHYEGGSGREFWEHRATSNWLNRQDGVRYIPTSIYMVSQQHATEYPYMATAASGSEYSSQESMSPTTSESTSGDQEELRVVLGSGPSKDQMSSYFQSLQNHHQAQFSKLPALPYQQHQQQACIYQNPECTYPPAEPSPPVLHHLSFTKEKVYAEVDNYSTADPQLDTEFTHSESLLPHDRQSPTGDHSLAVTPFLDAHSLKTLDALLHLHSPTGHHSLPITPFLNPYSVQTQDVDTSLHSAQPPTQWQPMTGWTTSSSSSSSLSQQDTLPSTPTSGSSTSTITLENRYRTARSNISWL
ncbi:hypothetical protein DFS34DRAFT_650096 [Phlyctochytrium arcticum]|nr:hypothetical protein DFS34DRAFT_650096 [Phlyctochytrium arcticum]